MSDQAQALRNRVSKKQVKIITVTSGKGGVGKSNFTTNLAIALKDQGKKPLILDADFGLANVEILLGTQPKYNLSHVINKSCQMEEVVTLSPQGVPFISGGSGVREMLFLTKEQIEDIANQFVQIEEMADVLLIDTGAGINEVVLKFSEIADEVYMIVTPEPASITDAYALIKTFVRDFNMKPTIKLVVNKAASDEEAQKVFERMKYVVEHFLKIEMCYGGFIPYDEVLFEAVKHQQTILNYAPRAKSSCGYRAIAAHISGEKEKIDSAGRVSLISRMKRIFSR